MDWWHPLLSTLQLVAVAVSISLAIGIPSAWATDILSRSGFIGRWLAHAFILAMIMAIAIPLILHAAAWEATAGKFGWLTMTQTGSRSFEAFRGLVASGWIHAVVGSAIVTVATWYGTRSQSRGMIEATSLDVGPLRAWWTIQLPVAWPWVFAACVANAGLAATEMTVVDLYGYRTIADEFYLFYAVNPNLISVIVTCGVPLAIAFTFIGIVIFSSNSLSRRCRLTQTRQEMDLGEHAEKPGLLITLIAAAIVTASLLVVVAVPVVGLIAKAGHQIVITDNHVSTDWSLARAMSQVMTAPRVFAREYQWTMVLGFVTGLLATLLAWPLASIGRKNESAERIMDIASVVMFCIPGPIVGLTVVGLFQYNIPLFRFLYEMTIVPTVMALSVRAIAVAYWVLRSGYRSIDNSVLASAKLDSLWWQCFWRIERPLLSGTLVTSILAVAIVASGDVPVTLPVAPPGVSTVGTRLFGLLHSGARYQEAALALWYLAMVLLLALAIGVGVHRQRARIVREKDEQVFCDH
ncbi:hypothetical protein CA13_44430 [Planctomycetes bacterium CA13]|uniref:ABC transmembrane type-1 domain-containing protein n=1 Tax=Novipirellula herctigrandis TaxID=2527986 RepID=A0A5C5Z711_9BACT|nr:hypothetical protein CA13_44430 [Planctomycetes bacterium CA13]